MARDPVRRVLEGWRSAGMVVARRKRGRAQVEHERPRGRRAPTCSLSISGHHPLTFSLHSMHRPASAVLIDDLFLHCAHSLAIVDCEE